MLTSAFYNDCSGCSEKMDWRLLRQKQRPAGWDERGPGDILWLPELALNRKGDTIGTIISNSEGQGRQS